MKERKEEKLRGGGRVKERALSCKRNGTKKEKKNGEKVSSFRFTAVVGEIWPCSYCTPRSGARGGGRQIYMVRTAPAALERRAAWTHAALH